MEELVKSVKESSPSISTLRDMLQFIQETLRTAIDKEQNLCEKYVTHKKDFIDADLEEKYLHHAEQLYNDAVLNGHVPGKTLHVWFGPQPYQFGHGPEHPARVIPKDSAVEDGRKKLQLSGIDSDGCNVTIYPNGCPGLGKHKDKEKIISQDDPISNISVGKDMNIIFTDNPGTKETRRSVSSVKEQYKISSKDLLIMHPGCQDKLYHEVPAVANNPDAQTFKEAFRANYSYRKLVPKVKDLKSAHQHSPSAPEKRKTIIVGDSMLNTLDPARLAKNGNECIKLLKAEGERGGTKIPRVKKLIQDYRAKNPDALISKVIIMVGANDTRHLKSKEEVLELKPAIDDLVQTTKDTFPSAEVFMVSLLPRKLDLSSNTEQQREMNKIRVEKFHEFNNMLYKSCESSQIKYVNAAPLFFRRRPGSAKRTLNMKLYTTKDEDEVHLSAIGNSVLARKFIYIINKHNNPSPTSY